MGYNLGVRWQPDGKDFLRRHVSQRLHDELQRPYGNHRASGLRIRHSQWPFPVKAIVGVSYRPTPKWNLEFDADYTDWSALGTVNVTSDVATRFDFP